MSKNGEIYTAGKIFFSLLGPYLTKKGSLLGPYLKAWGSLLVLETVLQYQRCNEFSLNNV